MTLSYQTVCGYRSAIAKLQAGTAESSIGRAVPVKRVIRGTFNVNPPIPRYSNIWNVDTLLSHLETLHPPDTLTDFQLSVKTCALLTVFSLSRASTVAVLAPSYQLVESEVVIPILALEKQSRTGWSCKIIK